MFKKYRILKWVLLSFTTIIIVFICFGLWFKSLIPPKNVKLKSTQVKDLPYLSENTKPRMGRILAVVTSTNKMGESGKKNRL